MDPGGLTPGSGHTPGAYSLEMSSEAASVLVLGGPREPGIPFRCRSRSPEVALGAPQFRRYSTMDFYAELVFVTCAATENCLYALFLLHEYVPFIPGGSVVLPSRTLRTWSDNQCSAGWNAASKGAPAPFMSATPEDLFCASSGCGSAKARPLELNAWRS